MQKNKKQLTDLITFSKSSKTALTLGFEIILGITTVLTSLLIFLKLADSVLEKERISFDTTIIHFIYLFRSPLMTNIMQTITFFGGQIFLGGAILLTIIILFRHYKKDALIFSFILIFGIALNLLLKDMFHRPRPNFLPLVHETSYSFPSGHTMNSFVFYMSLTYFIFRHHRNKKLGLTLSLSATILIILIGISRIYLGAHYPSDVLAGYTAGLCWFITILLFEKTLLFLRLFRKYEIKKK